MSEQPTRRDLNPIIALVGEVPSAALEKSIGDSSGDEGCGAVPDLSPDLGVSESLGHVVRHVAVALLYRKTLTMTAEEALDLALSPEGIAFLETAVAEYQGHRNVIRTHVDPFSGERRN